MAWGSIMAAVVSGVLFGLLAWLAIKLSQWMRRKVRSWIGR